MISSWHNTLFKIAIATVVSINVNILASSPTNAQRAPDTPLPDDVAQLILKQAAADTNLSVSELTIERTNAVTWPDGCMGINPNNRPCTRAMVDGWQVFVTSNSRSWIYHTNGFRALPTPEDSTSWWLRQLEEQRRREELRRRWANMGWTQENPVLPQIEQPGIWRFEDVPSRRWFDPPTEYGFRYTMTGNSLFTEVLDFPVGIDDDNLFTISVGDNILGEFSPGESVNFVSLLGNGVSEFTLTDINAPIDLESPTAFPLKIAFDTEFADFEMAAISEPADVPEGGTQIGLLALGLMGISTRIKLRQNWK